MKKEKLIKDIFDSYMKDTSFGIKDWQQTTQEFKYLGPPALKKLEKRGEKKKRLRQHFKA